MRLLDHLLPFIVPLVVIVIVFRVSNPDRIKIEFPMKLGSVEVSRDKPDDLPPPPATAGSA